jgi:hypothetical protein
MRLSSAIGSVVLIGALCLCAQGQNEAKGIPPRATPGDYQAHAAAGTVTVAAEFLGHSIPRPQGDPLTTDDYVVVETALFGPPAARLKISSDDFSLRINEKKNPSPSQPFGMVFRSLKDPDWEPPVPAESKSKTGISTGGKGGQSEAPAPVHMPIELQRAIQQHVQKAALAEGDRALPQAGLIFFPYRGKVEGIHSIELTYGGPAGKATLALQP